LCLLAAFSPVIIALFLFRWSALCSGRG
jgi:hypothetical protein